MNHTLSVTRNTIHVRMRSRLFFICILMTSLFFISCFDNGTGSVSMRDTQIMALPLNLSMQSSLSAEKSAAEASVLSGNPWSLFDGNAETSCAVLGKTVITLSLNGERIIRRVRALGAGGSVNLFPAAKGQPSEKITVNLKDSSTWATAETDRPFSAVTLTVELVPESGSCIIYELEIWCDEAIEDGDTAVYAAPGSVKTVEAVTGSDDGRYPHIIIRRAATEVSFSNNINNPAAITIDLPLDPALVRRAYLVYNGKNVVRPISVERRINGLSWRGGFTIDFRDEDKDRWIEQVEEISPAWLQKGDNVIQFRSGRDGISIKDCRLVLAARSGWNSVIRSSHNTLFDCDTAGIAEIEPDSDIIEMTMEQEVTADRLSLYLTEPTTCRAVIQDLGSSGWGEAPGAAVLDLSKAEMGWNTFELRSLPAAKMRMVFRRESADSSAKTVKISEIRLRTSTVSPVTDPDMAVSYPRNGEFYGKEAYVQGFLRGIGDIEFLRAEGIETDWSPEDRSFSAVLSNEKAVESKEWEPDPLITAGFTLLPSVSETVALYHNYYSDISEGGSGASDGSTTGTTSGDDSSSSDGEYTCMVKPGEGKIINLGNVTLEIPAGAVDEDTTIRIIPLSKDELPALNPGMVNVTYPAAGYRFLPHGLFNKNITLRFNYAGEFLLSGQTDDDVRMYFFDVEDKRWKPLEREAVIPEQTLVISKTNHFTDIINATLVTPEHPDPLSYNPNAIKDLKAADPSAGINLIDPPQARNTGDASLRYPIELPPGRGGLMPDLAVTYNSSGDNGWMGLGWNITQHSISTDTRFGVPKYAASDKYLLDGSALVPDGTSGQYRERVEGAFSKIVKTGDYWTVTGKDGTRFIYGQSSSARVAAGTRIFTWLLERIEDTNGNSINYYYQNRNITVSGETQVEVYPARITYTGYGQSDGPYSVVFSLEDDVRTDQSVSCRPGFRTAVRYRLRKVDVMFQEGIIRSYVFTYMDGRFSKSLLTKITQYGENGESGSFFNEHSLEYYDDIAEKGSFFSNGGDVDFLDILWNALLSLLETGHGLSKGRNSDFSASVGLSFSDQKKSSVGITGGGGFGKNETTVAFVDIDGDGLTDRVMKDDDGDIYYYRNNGEVNGRVDFDGERSPIHRLPNLGYEESVNGVIGLYGYFGGNGGHIDFGFGKSTSNHFFSDVDGDGRIDMVNGSDVRFNVTEPDGEVTFADQVVSEVSTGIVESPAGDLTDEELADAQKAEANLAVDSQAQTYYRDDPIRMWRAPFEGIISISGDVSLLKREIKENTTYETDDGVRISIQKGSRVLWSTEITHEGLAGEYPDEQKVTVSPPSMENLYVVPGEEIYFRVDSIFDGSFDIVEWDPVIEYVSQHRDDPDENGKGIYRYRASEDFLTAGLDQELRLNVCGTVEFTGTLTKNAVTSDNIRARLILKEINEDGTEGGSTEIYSEEIPWDVSGYSHDISETFAVGGTDESEILEKPSFKLICELESDTPVDWSAVTWHPYISYQTAYLVSQEYAAGAGDDPENGVLNGEMVEIVTEVDDVPAEITDKDDYPAMVFNVPVARRIYPERNPVSTRPYTVDTSGNVHITFGAELLKNIYGSLPGLIDDMPDDYEANITFAIKKIAAGTDPENPQSGISLLDKKRALLHRGADGAELVIDGTVAGDGQVYAEYDGYLDAGDRLYFVYSTDRAADSTADPAVEPDDFNRYIQVDLPRVTYETTGSETGEPMFYSLRSRTEAWGGGYRSWYYGRWCGEQDGDLDQSKMALPGNDMADSLEGALDDVDGITDSEDSSARDRIQEINNRMKNFSAMYFDQDYFWDEAELKWLPKRRANMPADGSAGDREMWVGNDTDTWISATEMSSTRLVKKYLEADGGTEPDIVPEVETLPGGYISGKNRGGRQETGFFSFTKGLALRTAGNISVSGGGTQTTTVNTTKKDFFDMNGDRRPDKVSGTVRRNCSTHYNMNVGLSAGATYTYPDTGADGETKGEKKHEESLSLSIFRSLSNGTTKTKENYLDVNGDGLPDKVEAGSSSLRVRLNKGTAANALCAAERFSGDDNIQENKTATVNGGVNAGYGVDKDGFGGGIAVSSVRSAVKFMFADINGDGLPDRIRKEVYSVPIVGLIVKKENMEVAFNTGSGFTAYQPLTGLDEDFAPVYDETHSMSLAGYVQIGIPIPIPFCPIFILINPGYNQNWTTGRLSVRFQDMNGDGLADHIYTDIDGGSHIFLNNTGKTNLLRRVRRPLGGSFEMEYERTGNTRENPQSRWALSKVTLHDGMTTPNTTHDYVSSYAYGDGYYDRLEREFYGYNSVVETRPDESTVVREYHNRDYYRKGLEIKNSIIDGDVSGGHTISETTQGYGLRDVVTSAVLSKLESKFPYLMSKTTNFYELSGTLSMSSRETYDYDAYGNVTTYTESGNSDEDDTVSAVIAYTYLTGSYIMNLPSSITVTGGGKLHRQRGATYDGKGNMVMLRQYMESGDGSSTAETNMEYDAYGNLSRLIGPANHAGERYALYYTFDSVTHGHIIGISDIFGYSSTAAIEYKYGKPSWTKDTNGNRISYVYDVYGRTAAIFGPYDTTGEPTISYRYSSDPAVYKSDGTQTAPAWARTMNKGYYASPRTIDVVNFMDGLGRVIQTKKTTEADGVPGMTVSGKVEYDHMGRVIREGQPIFTADGGNSYIEQSEPKNPAEYTNDILGRKTRIEFPDGTDISNAYGLTTEEGGVRMKTETTDQAGKIKSSLKDARGLIRAVKERINGGDSTTRYEYDPLKEITKVTDDKGNVTTVTYDMAGRRTAINNPDTGLVQYRYDSAGNLIRKYTPTITPGAIRYIYRFNRLMTVQYPDMSAVTYDYGVPGASYNRAGRLVSVDNGVMKTENRYGRLGEVTWTRNSITRTVPDTLTVSYETKYEFDSIGRLRELIYPDGEKLEYTYDRGGLVKGVKSYIGSTVTEYVKSITYDEYGQRRQIRYGNGTQTTYTYNELNRRLVGLHSMDSANKVLQNITYKYDAAGNITSKTNKDFTTTGEGDVTTEQTYTYDDLHRLTGYRGVYDKNDSLVPFGDSAVKGTNSFTYNSIGNIIRKEQTNAGSATLLLAGTEYTLDYEYGSAKPHAVTSDGTRTYTYDASGNMTQMAANDGSLTRTLAWDSENRLTRTMDNGVATDYRYDAGGTRVVKRGAYGEILYVNNNYTIRNGGIEGKHIFLGNSRLATKMAVKGETSSTSQDTYYYMGDHLGSSSVITNNTGQFHENLEYFPYGETWIHEKADADAESLPFKFTGKEQDPETGLYYYGARYYDARLGRWISVDPILNDYLPVVPVNDAARRHNQNLPGMGGVYNAKNIDLFSYSANNPIRYVDVDGNVIKVWVGNDFYILPYVKAGPGENGTEVKVSRGFNSADHPGVDSYPAVARPERIHYAQVSVAKGRVRYVGLDSVEAGNYIEIFHGYDENGKEIVTRYLHLDKVSIKAGDEVIKDQKIGMEGKTGCNQEHSHYEILVDGKVIDPKNKDVEKMVKATSGEDSKANKGNSGSKKADSKK